MGSSLDDVHLHVSVAYISRIESGVLEIILTLALYSTIVSIGSAIQYVSPYSSLLRLSADFHAEAGTTLELMVPTFLFLKSSGSLTDTG